MALSFGTYNRATGECIKDALPTYGQMARGVARFLNAFWSPPELDALDESSEFVWVWPNRQNAEFFDQNGVLSKVTFKGHSADELMTIIDRTGETKRSTNTDAGKMGKNSREGSRIPA